jgi:phosphoglycolate phosphatase
MKFKSVIFDLDGTLIDSIQDIADSSNIMLKQNGFKTHPVESYISWIGNGARLLIERTIPEIKDPAKIDKLLNEYRSIYEENCLIKTKIYASMDRFLDSLTLLNIPISILTNKPHSETLKITDNLLKNWNFKFILGQREGYPKKPDPKVAIEIANELNIDPKEFLFIGDSSTDIRTALAAGMKPVGVNWGYGTNGSMKEAGGKIFYDNPEDLLQLLSD